MTYKESFIKFMVDSGVLTFGEFTLKSGRKAPYFINTAINPLTYSGMSMYLPTSSRDVLNSLYKETPWNKATGLLK